MRTAAYTGSHRLRAAPDSHHRQVRLLSRHYQSGPPSAPTLCRRIHAAGTIRITAPGVQFAEVEHEWFNLGDRAGWDAAPICNVQPWQWVVETTEASDQHATGDPSTGLPSISPAGRERGRLMSLPLWQTIQCCPIYAGRATMHSELRAYPPAVGRLQSSANIRWHHVTDLRRQEIVQRLTELASGVDDTGDGVDMTNTLRRGADHREVTLIGIGKGVGTANTLQ
jgi:hypothetical protein